MDFDDLLLLTVRLFQAAPDVLDAYRTRFKHILVDEFQDTNHVQNEIVLMLAAEHHNVCVVGDSDQSIFGWRGADIRNIVEFEEAFPDAAVIPLEQNYRSTKTILDAANAVIANNVTRVPKELWTEGEPGRPHRALPSRGRVRRSGLGRRPRSAVYASSRASTTATSPCSTGPTPRAGRSRRSSCAPRSPTRWWGGPASTTGAR